MSITDYRDQGVQLCGPAKKYGTNEQALEQLAKRGFLSELKFDGVRCLALVGNGQVQLINRAGRDITKRYPDVVAALVASYPRTQIVLDGELVVLDAQGRIDFAAAHLRDAQSGAVPNLIAQHPATYMVFDVLHFEGDDIKHWPYRARRALCKVQAENAGHPQVKWSVSTEDVQTMWAFVQEHGLEGLILKDPKARYRPGDRVSWVKVKQEYSVSCLVTEWKRDEVGSARPKYNPGKGKRAGTIGSLNLTLIDNGKVFAFGEVGTGWTDKVLADLQARVDSHALTVVEVQVNGITKDRQPRFGSFKGIRTDIHPSDCTTSQLDGIPVA